MEIKKGVIEPIRKQRRRSKTCVVCDRATKSHMRDLHGISVGFCASHRAEVVKELNWEKSEVDTKLDVAKEFLANSVFCIKYTARVFPFPIYSFKVI